jgi:hypothetical protein
MPGRSGSLTADTNDFGRGFASNRRLVRAWPPFSRVNADLTSFVMDVGCQAYEARDVGQFHRALGL